MADRLFRAEPADALRIEPLDDFTLIFHRPSGLTHLVTAPVPEILAALGDGPLTRAALRERLSEAFDLVDGDEAALAARLDELAAIGLVDQR
jgi:PqqD family protein of HPr-rel-A system